MKCARVLVYKMIFWWDSLCFFIQQFLGPKSLESLQNVNLFLSYFTRVSRTHRKKTQSAFGICAQRVHVKKSSAFQNGIIHLKNNEWNCHSQISNRRSIWIIIIIIERSITFGLNQDNCETRYLLPLLYWPIEADRNTCKIIMYKNENY